MGGRQAKPVEQAVAADRRHVNTNAGQLPRDAILHNAFQPVRRNYDDLEVFRRRLREAVVANPARFAAPQPEVCT